MKETLWHRLIHGARQEWQRADWGAFARIDGIESVMKAAVTDRFHAKQGRSISRLILRDGNRRLAVYLKRHYRLPWWRGWLAAMWPQRGWSPAMEEKRHLEWARQQGWLVPEVVAAGETIGPWGRLQSFLALEELHDMLPLHEAIPAAAAYLDSHTFAVWKRTLVAELARLTRRLHDQCYFHNDLYLCHFYIPSDLTRQPQPWPGRVFLIDWHRLERHRLASHIWLVKDLAKLQYSSEVAGVRDRDRLAFWKAYWGPARRTHMVNWLRRAVLFRSRRYTRHNAKHPSLP